MLVGFTAAKVVKVWVKEYQLGEEVILCSNPYLRSLSRTGLWEGGFPFLRAGSNLQGNPQRQSW